MEPPTRLLPLVGAYNFRDLGGYPTGDGRRTRWGRLYRSDTLHELTDGDLTVLRDLGLRAVLDLRTADEVEQNGRGLLATEPIDYQHLSVIDQDAGESTAAPAPPGVDLAERYLWYLEIGRRALVRALEAMTIEERYPMVFHCTAGKDRTGVLAALVLDIVGVEPAVIAEDYLITATRLELIVARLRRDPVHGARLAEIPASRLAVELSTMQRFVELLYERHGGGRAWALAAGLGQGSLDRLPELLLEPDQFSDELSAESPER
jgi:protein-tyrosine phosphatase